MPRHSTQKTETKAQESEVIRAVHTYEFMRFYNKHKSLCDEISGLKKKILNHEKHEVLTIDKTNFQYAIKRLYAFLIDNIHYIKEKHERIELSNRIKKLQKDFLNNETYESYSRNYKSLSTEKLVSFNLMYFNYILECFEISYELGALLQTSLMVSTKDIKKSIKFYEFRFFYESLSEYRDEISEDIANFRYADTFNHLKKILGYVYTYKFLINKREDYLIMSLLVYLLSYVLNRETIKNIIALKKGETLTPTRKKQITEDSFKLVELLGVIYELVNRSLSDKNILPKVDKKILLDKTLI